MNSYEKGKYWELEVEKLLKKWKYKTERYITCDGLGNEIAQIWVYKDKTFAHPDFKIFNQDNALVMYVEVKNIRKFYNNFGYAGTKLSDHKDYVYIKEYNFSSYIKIKEIMGYDVRVVFIIGTIDSMSSSEWYWQDVSKLDNNKILITNPFGVNGDDEYFYFWDKNKITKIKNTDR